MHVHHHTAQTAQCIPKVGQWKQLQKKSFKSTLCSRKLIILSQSLSDAWERYARWTRNLSPPLVATLLKQAIQGKPISFARGYQWPYTMGNAARVLSSCKHFIYSNHRRCLSDRPVGQLNPSFYLLSFIEDLINIQFWYICIFYMK